MKKLICIIPNFDFGIYCDGENVDVFGPGETGESIKKIIEDPRSVYSEIVNNGLMDDPVMYWAASAQNFEYEIIPYSEENLVAAKTKIGE